jgi:hypothetical protein
VADHRPAVWAGQELPVSGCHRGGDRAVGDHRPHAVDTGHLVCLRHRDPGLLGQQEGLDGGVSPDTELHRDRLVGGDHHRHGRVPLDRGGGPRAGLHQDPAGHH